ncbi:hypothetical protein NXV69_14670 [Bacteroides ovatus]|nr:hypothetical protein [Bacteroides ovatus]
MASTNQINKVVELIVVLGDLLILNFCLFLLLFLYCFFDDDLAKSLLFGLFGISWKGLE